MDAIPIGRYSGYCLGGEWNRDVFSCGDRVGCAFQAVCFYATKRFVVSMVAFVFWAILTHPLPDACTTYGTQLLEPFSSLRVAWNVVSVADPLYTVPFLWLLIKASRQPRGSRLRHRYNWAGIL
ncbi:MAG: metal-dependent hydrolase [Saprospiraceae bacterium]